ncbi:MAG: Endonuclease III [candidate division WS6 bacterium 34_10]|jgi:endonuclease-3|uniref:Endonuclease III n=1 Tax=candidate division WS6 bacterium 34_10 TaxID=1641389 RepID=A0A101HGD0_9BACT|nr:MAG: Endonuclease III [candidate division WS6 bacterium 34_10]
MTKKEKAMKVLNDIEKMFPDASTELENWETPFQFLICIILSAQTTDKQVNKVTGKLFAKYPNAKTLSKADIEDVKNLVNSINYYKTKAKHIIETAAILDKKYDGNPPEDVEKLQELPGVGYKTANVFLNELYEANQGIGVDTHVRKVAKMYGLTKHDDPEKIAKDLEKIYPKEVWYKINRLFVLYGRYKMKK